MQVRIRSLSLTPQKAMVADSPIQSTMKMLQSLYRVFVKENGLKWLSGGYPGLLFFKKSLGLYLHWDDGRFGKTITIL
jgi:hypothetical protein